MIIDVSGILKEFGGKLDIHGEIEFDADAADFDGPIKIDGSICNNGQTLRLDAKCSGVLNTTCARCLKDIKPEIEFPVEENFVQDSDTVRDDDVIPFDGYTIDIDAVVLDSFYLNAPIRFVCNDDCKGLCPICGTDLNKGSCSCDNDYIDPRWSGLAEMLNRDK